MSTHPRLDPKIPAGPIAEKWKNHKAALLALAD